MKINELKKENSVYCLINVFELMSMFFILHSVRGSMEFQLAGGYGQPFSSGSHLPISGTIGQYVLFHAAYIADWHKTSLRCLKKLF
jgi:hypothetical protein